MHNRSNTPALRDGYDLPVYGLDNGLFYALHIPAVSCILTSLCCAIVAIAVSFRRHNHRSFFKWTKCDRFVVYLAVCDGCFNLVHICDHLQMVFTKDHVYPKELCQIYGFFIIIFVSAQNLIVNIVAINVFTLIYFNKHLLFGQWDWKLLLWTFGVPVSGAIVAAFMGQFGTTGAFCFFDGVKGAIGNTCFTTMPLLLILSMNIVFYALTWIKLRRETRNLSENLRQNASSRKAAVNAAQSMSLFVVAFFVQWSCGGVFGAWSLFEPVPAILFHLMTIFDNIGGILNLIVYVIVRRRELISQKAASSPDGRAGLRSHASVSVDTVSGIS